MWIELIKLIRKYLTPILIGIILIGSVSYIKQCNRANQFKELAETSSSKIKTVTEIQYRYRDKDSNEHVVTEPNILAKSELDRPVDSSTMSLIDSLSRELKIAKNTITDVSRVRSTYSTKTKGVKNDTTYTYTSPTMNWVFNPAESELQYQADLTLSRVDYTDGKRIFGIDFNADNIYSDIWWDDNNITIDQVDRIIVKQKVPKNSIKISGKTEYRFMDNTALTGGSAEVNLNRFSFEGDYLYNYRNNKWEPSVGIKYHIIK